MSTGLQDKVKALAIARRHYNDLGEAMRQRVEVNRIAFQEANAELEADLIAARGKMQEIEAEVRFDACAVFAQTGDKNPVPGVSVVIATRYDYPPDEALKWAHNRCWALKLDEKAFKEVCQADHLRPDFVTVIQEPQARIATDLEKAIGGIE